MSYRYSCLMLTVSTAPTESARQSKYENFHVYAATHKTDEQKKEEVDAVKITHLFSVLFED